MMEKMKIYKYIIMDVFNVIAFLPSDEVDNDFMEDLAGLYHINCKLNEVCDSNNNVYGFTNINNETIKLIFNFNNGNKYDIRCGDNIYIVGNWDGDWDEDVND